MEQSLCGLAQKRDEHTVCSVSPFHLSLDGAKSNALASPQCINNRKTPQWPEEKWLLAVLHYLRQQLWTGTISSTGKTKSAMLPVMVPLPPAWQAGNSRLKPIFLWWLHIHQVNSFIPLRMLCRIWAAWLTGKTVSRSQMEQCLLHEHTATQD